MSALDDVLPLLRCPHCGAGLERAADAVRCEQGHAFDLARQGYLSLLAGAGSPHTGDTAEMVAARERVLAGGHFEPLAEAIGEAVGQAVGAGAGAGGAGGAGRAGAHSPLIVELGAGTGWYLARLLDRFPAARGLALDVSKPALRRAARAHERLAAVTADAWGPLPLRDGVVAVVLNVFAPRNAAEIARVLGAGGRVLLVTAAPGHLKELVGPLGLLNVSERKLEGRSSELTWMLNLDRAAARDVAAMGPSAFHVSPAELDRRIEGLPQEIEVTAAVTLTLATAAALRARPPAPAAVASSQDRRRIPPASRPPRSPGGTG